MSDYHHLCIFLIGLLFGGLIGAVGMAVLTFARYDDD